MDLTRKTRNPLLKRLSPSQAFGAFVGLHVLLWTLLPALLGANLPLDTIEALSWGREWQAGYYKHPPTSAWLAELFRWGSADWPLFLLAQLAIGVAFWAVWQMARDLLKPWAALATVMALEGVHCYNLSGVEFNANVVQYPFWALAALAFWRAVRRVQGHGLGWWTLLGVACGFGVLGKYSFLTLPASMVLALVAVPALRSQWRGPGPWLALGLAIAMFLPHLLWAQAHDFPTLRYATSRAVIAGPGRLDELLKFFGAQAITVAPLLLLLWAAAGRIGAAADGTRAFWRRPDRDGWVLLAIGLGPLLVYFAAGAAGVHLHDLWTSPLFLTVAPGLAVAWRLELRHPRRFAIGWSLCTLLLVSGYLLLLVGMPLVTGRLSRIQYPGRELAAAVSQGWQQARGPGVPLPIVAGDPWLAGNVAQYLPPQAGGRPSVYIQTDPDAAPWLDDAQIRARGAVFVWTLDQPLPAAPPIAWQQRFPGLQPQPPLTLTVKRFGRDFSVRVAWGILPPNPAP